MSFEDKELTRESKLGSGQFPAVETPCKFDVHCFSRRCIQIPISLLGNVENTRGESLHPVVTMS